MNGAQGETVNKGCSNIILAFNNSSQTTCGSNLFSVYNKLFAKLCIKQPSRLYAFFHSPSLQHNFWVTHLLLFSFCITSSACSHFVILLLMMFPVSFKELRPSSGLCSSQASAVSAGLCLCHRNMPFCSLPRSWILPLLQQNMFWINLLVIYLFCYFLQWTSGTSPV